MNTGIQAAGANSMTTATNQHRGDETLFASSDGRFVVYSSKISNTHRRSYYQSLISAHVAIVYNRVTSTFDLIKNRLTGVLSDKVLTEFLDRELDIKTERVRSGGKSATVKLAGSPKQIFALRLKYGWL